MPDSSPGQASKGGRSNAKEGGQVAAAEAAEDVVASLYPEHQDSIQPLVLHAHTTVSNVLYMSCLSVCHKRQDSSRALHSSSSNVLAEP